MAIRHLKDKVVVVTGAASGIGRETALAFAREGAHIVAADLKPEPLDAVRREVEALGVSCMSWVVDVADEAAMKGFAEAVAARFGAPHVVVNNAGIGFIGPFLASDLAHWKRMLHVNVMGVVHGCYFFLPGMLAAGGPRSLLNVSSSAGNFPSPSMAAYGASKGAVSNFTEVLKMELAGRNVHVATVCPGVVNTQIIRSHLGTSPSVSDATLQKLRAYYDSDGCTPDVIARDMVRAVKRDVDLVLTGPKSRLLYHVRRVSLGLLRALMIRFSRQAGFLE
jgi:NAD(P)-dependent dehydrogenase (short-subunit alcohol dehydrogenase family)